MERLRIRRKRRRRRDRRRAGNKAEIQDIAEE
jgi:hypothetical protein